MANKDIEMEKKKDGYSASDLTVLHNLEPITTRPGMYIGSTDYLGTHHLAWEIIDNAVDEVVAGFGNTIKVTINEDGSLTIEDQGRGIPYDFNKKEGKDGFDIIFQYYFFYIPISIK